MSIQKEEALASINRLVFSDDPPIVVAIVAGWGEGKTYFWQHKVLPSHPGSKPGFVSVFGAESLAVIRERVAIASTGVAEFAESGVIPEWVKKIAGPLAKEGRRAANFWTGMIGVSDSLGVELLQNFGVKPGWILCIDDVERLAPEIGYENFLGYVSELRDKRGVKVVLIFNREPIDADKKSAFHLYQEKVIDRVIPFVLDLADVVNLVFGSLPSPGFDAVSQVRKHAEVLSLRNIRVLSKAKAYFVDVVREVGPRGSPEFLQGALASIVLFTYTKFSNQKPKKLTFEALKTWNSWSATFKQVAAGKKGAKQPTSVLKLTELLDKYRYTSTDETDLVLMQFVQNDLLDAEQLRAAHRNFQNSSLKRAAEADFRSVWDRGYHGTLRDNADELCDSLEATLMPHMENVPINEVDYAMHVMFKLGRPQQAAKLFRVFKGKRASQLENPSFDSHMLSPIYYAPLKKLIRDSARAHQNDQRPIEEVMDSAFKESFVQARDAERLTKFSVAALTTYFVEHDQAHLTKKLQLLTQANNQQLLEKALRVARTLAARSKINRLRMEGMGLVKKRAPRK